MISKSNSLVVERVEIDALRPTAPQVRHHSKKHRAKIQKSVDVFGQVAPIPVTPDGEIIDLELVWRALKESGATHVNVIVIADKSPAEIKALRLMLNRSAQDGVWDDDNLKAVFQALIDINFDLALTGFEQAEIDIALEIEIPHANVVEDFDSIPKPQDRAVSRREDIFQLGAHRIGCGDARDQRFVDCLREGHDADVCIADAPYNLKISGFGFGKNRHRQGDFVEASGEMSKPEFYALIHDSLNVMRGSCSPSALLYVFMDWRHILELTAAGEQLGLALANLCVWVKPNGGLGGLYRSRHELVAVFKAGFEPHQNNVELGKFGRNRTNVWNYEPPSAKDELLGAHPTVKPVAMLADILRDCTKRGSLVLDPFLGSGSTLIAAEETGRACIGVELDPHYLDVTIRRWQAISGRDAIHLASGHRFDDMTQRLLAHTEARHGE